MDASKAAFQLGIDLGRAPQGGEADAASPRPGTAPRKAQTEAPHSTELAAAEAARTYALPEHTVVRGPWPSLDERHDHFVRRDGKVFAGTHLIIDLWGASRLDELDHVEAALREAVDAAGATLLHIHLHHFTPNGGISGVAVLAESHISIHTWPECDYAALDVFMCGDARPENAIPVLKKAFGPADIGLSEILRGEVCGEDSAGS